MSNGATLKQMVRAQIPLDRSKKQVVLWDSKQPEAKLTITNVPKDAVVINVDACDRSNFDNALLLSGAAEEGKVSDFIIASAMEKAVLFVELKAGPLKPEKKRHVVNQLKGSLCVWQYCQSVARNFYGEHDFFSCSDQHMRYRYIAFTNLRRKRASKLDDDSGGDSPNKMRVVKSSKAAFGQLAK